MFDVRTATREGLPENPLPGATIAIAHCPQCGAPAEELIFNPFRKRRDQADSGWVPVRYAACRCAGSDPLAPPPPRTPNDLGWLDLQLNRDAHRHQTFLCLPAASSPQARAANLFCQRYARHAGPAGSVSGVFLVGTPSPFRDHLLAALTNAHRARGAPTALLSYPQLLDHLGDPDPERRERLTWILGRICILSLSGVASLPATPVELKPVVTLLDRRYRRGLTTHCSGHATPKLLRQTADRAGAHPIHAELAALLERATLSPIPVP